MFCHVPPIFLFCLACTGSSLRSRRQGTRGRHEMSCFVMLRGAASFPCRVSPASFLLPVPRLPAAEPFFARIAPACPRASPPARFARLIARAREAGAGRTSPVRFSGVFKFAPARAGRRSGPARMPPPSCDPISSPTSRCQPFSGNKSEKRTCDCNRTRLSGSPPACERGRSVRPRHSTAMSAAATRRSSAISTL